MNIGLPMVRSLLAIFLGDRYSYNKIDIIDWDYNGQAIRIKVKHVDSGVIAIYYVSMQNVGYAATDCSDGNLNIKL